MVDSTEKTPILVVNGKVYDIGMWIALIALPAFSAAYFSLGDLWNLPAVTGVVGTCAVIATFMGALLKGMKAQYDKSDVKYDGSLIVNTADENKDAVGFEFKKEMSALQNQKELVLKVEDLNG